MATATPKSRRRPVPVNLRPLVLRGALVVIARLTAEQSDMDTP